MPTTMRARIGLRQWAVAGAMTATLAAGCECPGDDDITPLASEYQPLRPGRTHAAFAADCQQDSVIIFVPLDTLIPPDSAHSVYDTVTAADMPLVARIANLPEYHDCQRFVVPSQAAVPSRAAAYEFGPLVAIWAADSLAARFTAEPGSGGTASGPALARPVAMIHNWGERVSYEPLGIRPGFSCLYLWNDPNSQGNWSALVVPLGTRTSPCQEAAPPASLVGTPLEVHALAREGGLRPKDIPEVARWDWDSTHMQQYIGIRCGDQWCEIGSKGFVSSPGASATGMTETKMKGVAGPVPGLGLLDHPRGEEEEVRRAVAVKGWYDQQYLDTLGVDGKPMLTGIVGTVFPHPALGRAPFKAGRWTPSAYVIVSANYPGKVVLPQGLSAIYLCKDGARKCKVPPNMACAAESGGGMASTDLATAEPLTTWYTRIVSEGGGVQYHCVKRRMHGGHAIPAAATRWNWSELDATTWVACSKGCCTVN
jgi:hypothetical protein